MEAFFFKKIVSVDIIKIIRSLIPLMILFLVYGVVMYLGWRYA